MARLDDVFDDDHRSCLLKPVCIHPITMIPYMERVMNLQLIGGMPQRWASWEKINKRENPQRLVQLYHCTVTSCFFIGASNEEEPARYEEAKGCPEAAIQEQIEALHKNETWELVPKFRFSTSGSLLLRGKGYEISNSRQV